MSKNQIPLRPKYDRGAEFGSLLYHFHLVQNDILPSECNCGQRCFANMENTKTNARQTARRKLARRKKAVKKHNKATEETVADKKITQSGCNIKVPKLKVPKLDASFFRKGVSPCGLRIQTIYEMVYALCSGQSIDPKHKHATDALAYYHRIRISWLQAMYDKIK